ncbi:MAG TPA: hypothetical protein VIJ50_07975 [Solirubrobacteraceae bacterium]
MRPPLPALVLVTGTLLLAGCGGSSKTTSSSVGSTNLATTGTASVAETSGTSTPNGSDGSLSHSQFLTDAGAICSRVNSQLAGNRTINNQQDIKSVAPRRAEIEQAGLTEMGKLTPPASIARDYAKLLAARRTLVEDLRKLGKDAATDPKGETAIFVSSASLARQMEATAGYIHLEQCGTVG